VNPQQGRRRRAPVDAAMACVIVLLIVQMWLLTATLESYLAGHHGVAASAFVVSACLFLVCGALYLMVSRLDRGPAPGGPPSSRPGPWRVGQR
jgi:hydrogenase-4 membrane subunit HyfE